LFCRELYILYWAVCSYNKIVLLLEHHFLQILNFIDVNLLLMSKIRTQNLCFATYEREVSLWACTCSCKIEFYYSFTHFQRNVPFCQVFTLLCKTSMLCLMYLTNGLLAHKVSFMIFCVVFFFLKCIFFFHGIYLSWKPLRMHGISANTNCISG